MALSFNQYTGNGSNRNFALTYDYLDRSHISVRVNGNPVAFSWLDTYTVQTAVAPAAGTAVDVRRTTPRETRSVDFVDGSVLTEADLDLSSLQVFFIVQEAIDIAGGSLNVEADGAYGAGNRRLSRLADPQQPQDAVTKNWVETANSSAVFQAKAAEQQSWVWADMANTFQAQAGASKDAAQASQGAAATSASNAATSASTATGAASTATTKAAEAVNSANSAATSASTAAISAEWADKAENSAITNNPGKFSARHWAAKAQAFAAAINLPAFVAGAYLRGNVEGTGWEALSKAQVKSDLGYYTSGDTPSFKNISVLPELDGAGEGGQINLIGATGYSGCAFDTLTGDARLIGLGSNRKFQIISESGAIELVPGGFSSLPNLRLSGAALKYLEAESNHVAFYRASGGNGWFWRRSTSGRADGSGEVEQMTLTEDSMLRLKGGANTGVAFQNRDDWNKEWAIYGANAAYRVWSNTTGENFRVQEDGHAVSRGRMFTNNGANEVFTSANFNPGLYQLASNAWHTGNFDPNSKQNTLGYTPLPSVSLGVGLAHSGSLGVEITNSNNGAAAISFHRGGSYAVNFGIDTDNNLRIGGWSMGQGVSHRILHEGNLQPFTKHGLGQYITCYYGSGPSPAIDQVWGGGGATILSSYQMNNGGGGAHIGGQWTVRGQVSAAENRWLLQRTA